MPLRYGASRSVSDAQGITPQPSIVSMYSELRQSQAVLASRGASASRAVNASRNTSDPLSEERLEEKTPWWYAPLDSGFFSNLMFLAAMVLYIIAIPLGQGDAHDIDVQSHLWLVACSLFILESLLDLLWSAKRWLVMLKLKVLRRQLDPDALEMSHDGGLETLLDSQGNTHCAPWLDRINWDFWCALFFLIPSCFYLIGSLLDPNIVVLEWLNVMRGAGWSNEEMKKSTDDIAASIYLVDSVIGALGRYSYRRTTPQSERLILFDCSKCRGFFTLDWAAYGDMLFLVGTWVEFFQVVDEYNLALDWTTQILWMFDALFYIFACGPPMMAMLRSHGPKRQLPE